jgi:hypothetical protein
MSHVATITLEFRDPAVLAEAATACGLTLSEETITFYDLTRVHGMALRLRGWQYPVVIDASGQLFYDNYEGRWGDLAELHRFRRAYAEVATARFARTQGYRVSRATQADGTVRLVLSR